MANHEAAKRAVEGYLNTLDRMEPEIHHIDASAFYASAAVSLKRIADSLERMEDRRPKTGPVQLDKHTIRSACLNCGAAWHHGMQSQDCKAKGPGIHLWYDFRLPGKQ